MTTLIYNARVCSDLGYWERGWLTFDKGLITACQAGDPPAMEAQKIDAQGLLLMAGLVDIHIHGCAGQDVMDATPETLPIMSSFLAEHGVTGFLPTTLTNPHEKILAALRMIQAEMTAPHATGAKILGGHLEGPYLNLEKCGAQNPEYIRTADAAEVAELLAVGCLRLVDVAPEIPENQWLIEACVERGITVSVAHSSGKYDDVFQAAQRGLSHATHTYNAMTGLHHREVGVLGAVMSLPNIACELIADNIHVQPVAMKILWDLKRPDKLILISDAVRAAGMRDGEYQFDDRTVILKDGAVLLPDGTLAGSVLTMNCALYNFAQAVSLPLHQVWQTASLNPARAIGLDQQKGSLTPHKDADLILVDDRMGVYLTVVEGKIVYQDRGVA